MCMYMYKKVLVFLGSLISALQWQAWCYMYMYMYMCMYMYMYVHVWSYRYSLVTLVLYSVC